MSAATCSIFQRAAALVLKLSPIVTAAAVIAACFDDLPEPTVCPPEAQLQLGVCELPEADPPGRCLRPHRIECQGGTERACDCDGGAAQECPHDDTACYPSADCPPAVTENFAGATCVGLLAGTQPTRGELATEGCVCGCFDCLAQCDGKGPILAIYPAAEAGQSILQADYTNSGLGDGKLGVYLWMRGEADLLLSFGDEEQVAIPAAKSVWGFEARMAQLANLKSRRLELVAGPRETKAEIDCIIPFVAP